MVFKSILSTKWLHQTQAENDLSALDMATTIHTRAVMLAPEESGALVNSGRVERIGKAFYRIIFGSSQVPYARIRHYENKKNPQTLGYLEKAGDSVSRGNVDKFLRKR